MYEMHHFPFTSLWGPDHVGTTPPTCYGAPRAGSLFCACGMEDTPRLGGTSGLHQTECQTLGMTLNLWITRRYNVGDGDLVSPSPCISLLAGGLFGRSRLRGMLGVCVNTAEQNIGSRPTPWHVLWAFKVAGS